MPELPERKYVKLNIGGIGFTVPEEELAYYKRAGALEEGEKADETNLTPAEKRMRQIERGEQPTNQVSSLALENADLPATEEEKSVAVNLGPVDSGVAGPAASAEAREDAREKETPAKNAPAEETTVKVAAKKTKKAGK
jgi:hypothetical protein